MNNTFQVVLGTDTSRTVSLFIYDDIQSGSGAQIGFNAGDGITSFTLPEALTSLTLDMEQRSNIGLPGVFIYRLDSMLTCIVSIYFIELISSQILELLCVVALLDVQVMTWETPLWWTAVVNPLEECFTHFQERRIAVLVVLVSLITGMLVIVIKIYKLIGTGMVECSSTPNCSFPDLGVMTTEECCVDNPIGRSFIRPESGVPQCQMCIGMFIIIIMMTVTDYANAEYYYVYSFWMV